MSEPKPFKARSTVRTGREPKTSRIPGFYRLTVERRLALLAKNFDLSERQIAQLRDGNALRVEHAVNMVENSVGVLGQPLGLGLNFQVNGQDYIAPMAIEEASIIAAASKAALMIRNAGGFTATVDEPVMIGQIQVMDLDDPVEAVEKIRHHKQRILDQANLAGPRMVARGGGVFDLETRILDGGERTGRFLVVHLLINVLEAMGANAINAACEAAGPTIEEITGGRVNLRILSNYADRRLARAGFRMQIKHLATEQKTGEEVAKRLVESAVMANVDPYRAATHNKGIFNGIGAASLALGQDWRAIEAGGHTYATRDGQYRSLTNFAIEDGELVGSIELPMQVGWVGGAVNSHPGVKILRTISGVENAGELAGLLASVGLAQNFAACLALSTVGIQKGHMALHARSVAISVGVPPEDVEDVAQEMIRRGEVKVAAAEEIYRTMQNAPKLPMPDDGLPIEVSAPGKVVLFGEHATVYNYPGITASIDVHMTIRLNPDADGPRFLNPKFKQAFAVPKSDQDLRMFSHAVNEALTIYDLHRAPLAIEIESDLVPGMGLGSSAAFSVALCTAMRRFKKMDDSWHWRGEIFNDVQKLEAIFHGHPSGMDAATVLSDGVMWFRKGPPREILPIRLPHSLHGLIIMVEPGARTIELVRQVQRSRDLNPKRVDGLLDEIGNLTTDAGIALGLGDSEEVGRLMFRNHELLSKLGVSTPKLDEAVTTLLDYGALGAKLTGSGGGGAVIALVQPEQQNELVRELKKHYAKVLPFSLGASV